MSVADVTERRRSMEAFRQSIEVAPTGMMLVDSEGSLALVNTHMEALFGYERGALVGRAVETLVPERFRGRHVAFRATFFASPITRPMGAGRSLYGLRQDGSEFPIEVGLHPLKRPEGDFVLGSIIDITRRVRAEQEKEALLEKMQVMNSDLEERVRLRTAELSATLREREVLLQEVHHRVKNNLQLISSLINMQSRTLVDRASRNALAQCQTRIQAMALVHEKLYQSKDYSRVPFSEYARSLAGNVLLAMGASAENIVLDIALEGIALGLDRAIPCGMILNELVTNAMKHGFRDGQPGTISLRLEKLDGGWVRLAVGDNGVGIPPETDLRNSGTLGMRLVFMLARQLDGRIEWRSEGGTLFELTFPAGTSA
jgi:PAS domain S-box-containing protein